MVLHLMFRGILFALCLANVHAGLKVMGLGFPRTGTETMSTALSILGYKAYHMRDCMSSQEDIAFWTEMYHPDHPTVDPDINGFFDARNVTAVFDLPALAQWKRLVEENPDAKFVLTVRDPESWWKSIGRTILIFFEIFPFNVLRWIIPDLKKFERMVTYSFAALWPFMNEREPLEMADPGNDTHKERAVAAMLAHNEEVQRFIPKEKLLVWKIGEGGWSPLCDFLGEPIPDHPFPFVNSYTDFKLKQFLFLASAVGVGALAVGALVLVLYLLRFRKKEATYGKGEKMN